MTLHHVQSGCGIDPLLRLKLGADGLSHVKRRRRRRSTISTANTISTMQLPLLVGVTEIRFRFAQLSQEAFQLDQFPVVHVIKPRFNGNTVIDLIPKGVGRIVHEDRFRQVPAEYTEILQKVAFDGQAAFAKEAVVKNRAVCMAYYDIMDMIFEEKQTKMEQECETTDVACVTTCSSGNAGNTAAYLRCVDDTCFPPAPASAPW
jgi:hypothetical protein